MRALFNVLIRWVVPLAVLCMCGFDCNDGDPCADCSAVVSTITITIPTPFADHSCDCQCEGGEWVISIRDVATNDYIAGTRLYVASGDPDQVLVEEVPPCTDLSVDAYFVCTAVPGGMADNPCPAYMRLNEQNHPLGSDCGRNTNVRLYMCTTPLRTSTGQVSR